MGELNNYKYCPYDGSVLMPHATAATGLPTCPRCGFVDYQNPRPCVAILIISDGKLLLARRGIEPAKGAWDIPGGFVEDGESAEEAVVREALEETTLHVQVTAFLGSIPDIYGDRETPTLNLCYMADVVSGEPSPRSDVESLAWFSMTELPNNLAFAHQTQVIALLQERIKNHE